MANIVDALVITLGLDASQFVSGSKDASASMRKTRQEGGELAKGLEQAGKKGAEGFISIRREALALLAVFTGGLGFERFVKNTIEQTAALSRTSQDLGVSAQRLAQWQIAAQKAGGTADGITNALKGASAAIGNFRLGDASGVMSTIQAGARVGVQFDPKEGAEDFLRQQAEIIARTERQYGTDVARSTAQRMGVGDDSYHFLRGGAAAVDSQLDANKRLAQTQADLADRAEKLRQRWVDLSNTLSDSAITAVSALEPALERLVGWLTKLAQWVDDHRNDIAQWFTQAANTIEKIGSAANNAAQALGGWQNVLLALAGIKILGMAGSVLRLASALGVLGGAATGVGSLAALGSTLGVAALALHSDDLDKGEDDYMASRGTMDDLRNKANSGDKDALRQYIGHLAIESGYTSAQAAGILGNLQQESSMDPSARNGNMVGLAQWNGARQAQFQKLYGKPLSKALASEQASFLFWELNNTESRAGQFLKRATTTDEAADAVAWHFERPYGSGPMSEANVKDLQNRRKYAGQALSQASAIVPPTLNAGTMRGRGSTSAAADGGATDNSVTMSGQFHFHMPNVSDAGGFARALPGALRSSTASQANSGVS